jgi:hypothetical protein
VLEYIILAEAEARPQQLPTLLFLIGVRHKYSAKAVYCSRTIDGGHIGILESTYQVSDSGCLASFLEHDLLIG